MQFRVEAVYKDEKGRQRKFIIRSKIKTEIITDFKRLSYLFNTHECENAVLISKNGAFYLRGKGCNLKFITLTGSHVQSNKIADIYTGADLKQLITTSGVLSLNNRDFVAQIIQYSQTKENRLFGVSGLRGMGKTTGFLQAIYKIGYERCAYLVIKAVNNNSAVTCRELFNLIKKISTSGAVDFIFVDEITRIRNFISEASVLFDDFTNFVGKKLFISGTESLSLSLSKNDSLYHRIYLTSVTFINYAEAKRTIGLSLNEYISMGGLYKADAFNDVNGMYDYVYTAVLQNIKSTITRNDEILVELKGVSDAKLIRIIFIVLYAVIFTKLKYQINLNRVTNLFDLSNSVLGREDLNNLLKNNFGIADNSEITEIEFQTVLSILMRIGLVIRIENLCVSGDYQYCITNQCMTNVLLRELVGTVQRSFKLQTTLMAKTLGVKSIKGLIFEALVLTHAYQFMSKYRGTVYYYRDIENQEVDLVLKFEGNDEEEYFFLYEIKMSNDKDTAVLKTTWLNNTNITAYLSKIGKVYYRGIIYGGSEEGIFESFTNSDLSIKSDSKLSISQIEQLNRGTHLIPAQAFLLDMQKYSYSILEPELYE